VFPAPALTTSWQRFTYTFTLPSISGKTIGTGSCLIFYIRNGGTASGANLDIWGAQLEAGSVATAFQTATGTLQGELSACQRYYEMHDYSATNSEVLLMGAFNTSTCFARYTWFVPKRIAPTITIGAASNFVYYAGGLNPSSLAAGTGINTISARIDVNGTFTAGYSYDLRGGAAGSTIQISAEL
jgi:hypothetical protein